MPDQFIGQIVMGGFAFAPRGFAACDGQVLPINQNQALFALLQTYYGGNGSSTFALPDLRGRTPVGYAPSRDLSWQPPLQPIGAQGGLEAVSLLGSQIPAHGHTAMGSSQVATSKLPGAAGAFAATVATPPAPPAGTPLPYGPDTPANLVGLSGATLAISGQSRPHSNLQPLNVLNFVVALNGVWPSRP